MSMHYDIEALQKIFGSLPKQPVSEAAPKFEPAMPEEVEKRPGNEDKKRFHANTPEYLEDPNFCPFCKSISIDAGDTEFNGRRMYQNVTCRDCTKEWTDGWTLTDVDPFEEI